MAGDIGRPFSDEWQMTARRTSEILLRMVGEARGPERLTVGTVVARLGERSFGMLYLLLGLISFVPAPPGFGLIVGLALMLVSAQMIVGRQRPWLPGFVSRAGTRRKNVGKISRKLARWLRWLENLARPRLSAAVGPAAERVIGMAVFFLAFLISLPVPFFGNTPPAAAVLLFALGLIERDGAMILIAFVLTAVVTLLSGGLAWAAVEQLALFW